jgi:hypothetical protein
LILTINVAFLLAIIIVFRLRRDVVARSRFDEKMTVVIVMAFGILIAPTDFGQAVGDFVTQLARGVTQAGGSP